MTQTAEQKQPVAGQQHQHPQPQAGTYSIQFGGPTLDEQHIGVRRELGRATSSARRALLGGD